MEDLPAPAKSVKIGAAGGGLQRVWGGGDLEWMGGGGQLLVYYPLTKIGL